MKNRHFPPIQVCELAFNVHRYCISSCRAHVANYRSAHCTRSRWKLLPKSSIFHRDSHLICWTNLRRFALLARNENVSVVPSTLKKKTNVLQRRRYVKNAKPQLRNWSSNRPLMIPFPCQARHQLDSQAQAKTSASNTRAGITLQLDPSPVKRLTFGSAPTKSPSRLQLYGWTYRLPLPCLQADTVK